MTQVGTAAPTVTVLQNTIGNIVWTRVINGSYHGTLTGAFPANKTAVFVSRNATGPSPGYMYGSRYVTNDAVMVTSGSVISGPGDDYITDATIEIRVYP